MPTLAEMNYREQPMPDGCWNCKWHSDLWEKEISCSLTTTFGDVIEINGICDRYEKEGR